MPLKALVTIFSILTENSATKIELTSINSKIDQEQDTYKNGIIFRSTGRIEKTYTAKIITSSLNIYDNNNNLIASEPEDSWGSCCIVKNDIKDVWFPRSFVNFLLLFPEEYFSEIYIYEDDSIRLVIKDKIENLFDNKEIMAEFFI
jgi:hypothetical protein